MSFYSSKLDKLYEELLDQFSKKQSVFTSKKYCLIYPTIGNNFEETGLVICGRATNGGFGERWTIPQIKTKKDRIINKAKTLSWNQWDHEEFENRCRLQSFFRLTKRILLEYYKVDYDEYQTCFTWTNLMKIAPDAGGNPNSSEFNAQVEVCTDIFKYEIDSLKPKNIVLFAGAIVGDNNWAYDFMKKLGICCPVSEDSKKPIVAIYDYNQTRIIQCIRPERKPLGYTEDMFFKDIIKNLK